MLELKNINYALNTPNGKIDILKDINLKFDSGTVVITGPNGSGKSTLVKIIMGIITPTSGKVIFKGKDISKLTITQRANLGINFAFQNPVRFKGLSVKTLLEKAKSANVKVSDGCNDLSQVGLCARDYLNRDVDSSLSGGEIKRIEIATALAKKGDLYIFDEPEAGIDIWSFKGLISCFGKIDKSKLTLIISHQEKLIDFADYILILKGGKVSAYGKKEDILPQISHCDFCEKIKGGRE